MGEIDLLKDLVEVQEGLAKILVPRVHAIKGPGTVGPMPFYNETMSFPRHVSVLFADAVGMDAKRVLDGLASSGVLGIRLALETHGSPDITLNDKRRDAHDLIARNVALNGIGNARVTCEDLNLLLAREHYDYVDVDPFGTPAPFLHSALRSLAPRGYLSATATDTAALAGTYPRVCQRRYGATSAGGPYQHELAVRILSGFVVRSAATYDLAARPLLSLWREHYYKVFLELVRGARKADEALRSIAKVALTAEGERRVSEGGTIGPLWVGSLHDREMLSRMNLKDYMPPVVGRLHELWSGEAHAPPLFYTTDEVSRTFRRSPPPLRRVLDHLETAGFPACRTSFHPKGFKTEASWEEVLRILKPR